VKGLGKRGDNIAEKYIGDSEEVIMRNIHDAISSVLHGAARYSKRVKLADLRDATVKDKFDRSLKDALVMESLRWEAADKELIQRYFQSRQG
jgi:hypothetical protein